MSGVSIAARLAQSGLAVTLLEASRLGFEASSRNQGWLHSGGILARYDPELARMCYESLQQTVEFCPDCLEPEHHGMWYLVSRFDTEERDWLQAWTQAGIPWSVAEREDVLAAFPTLNGEHLQRAYLLPDRAFRPEILLAQLAVAARNAGAEIRTETAVVHLLQDEHQLLGVVTGTGEEIHACRVILATGALTGRYWATALTPTVGGQTDYQRVVVKTHLVAVQPALGAVPFCVVDRGGFCHIPHLQTSVFGANRWLLVGDPLDHAVQQEELAVCWSHMQEFFPRLTRARCDRVTEWAGTTMQAMHVDQIEPTQAARPTFINHGVESPRMAHLWSAYPGRATLWAHLAEEARCAILADLGREPIVTSTPPWAVVEPSSHVPCH
jgi:glycine/D-amino acid oxidase-like deaminating enzyme